MKVESAHVQIAITAFALCIGFGVASHGCKRQNVSEQPAFLAHAVGLEDAHRQQLPMLEMLLHQPRIPGEARVIHAQRLYADGSYYLLPIKDAAAVAGPWGLVGQVSKSGVAQLQALFADLCSGVDPLLGNDVGSAVYRVNVPQCLGELRVTGVPDGDLRRLVEVHNIINANVKKRGSE